MIVYTRLLFLSLRRIAAAIQASKNPDRRLVARDLKKIISILLNKPKSETFYVDWEGRGYTSDLMKSDIQIMKKTIGEGPIYAGSIDDFTGEYFSSTGGPIENLIILRGGLKNTDSSPFMRDNVLWRKFSNWDELINEFQLF